MKLSSCLSDLGITDASPFEECDGIDEEFKVIKKAWTRKVMREHPDKGGDPAAFRATHAAFRVLRDVYSNGSVKKGTYTTYLSATAAAASDYEDASDDEEDVDDDDVDDDDLADLYAKYANNTNVPSYEYFAAAAEEDVPGYKVELAKSGRSKCAKCKENIAKNGIRVGWLDKVAGTYGKWNHLDCWRVPKKVQNGLTNPSEEEVSLRDLLSMEEVLLTGVAALDEASQRLFVQRCVDSEHWAGNKRKHKQIMGDSGSTEQAASKGAKAASKSESASRAAKSKQSQPSVGVASVASGVPASAGSNTIVAGSFVVLVPGVDGALNDEKLLQGQSFVITGTFPEVGGGDVDSVGVANVGAMIQSFGGKVISRFSKNTIFIEDQPGLLLGHMSLESLAKLPSLTSDVFIGNAYSAAGAPPPAPPSAPQRQETAQRSASASSSKKPAVAAKGTDEKKPSKPKSKAEDSKPAAAKMATTLANNGTASKTSSQAMVARANSNGTSNTSSAVVPHTGKKAKFTIPRPGVNGGVAGALDDKRFVLTGVFPELGGGAGLSLGKDRTTSMIESFGGRVTSAVSGKTDFVLVGKDPGRSKVSQADKRGVPLIDLLSLQRLLVGQSSLEAAASAPPPRITAFSAGYPGQKRIAY
ncbi:hypothetical protein ACHAXR_011088 [Thalassiosira sp. AJA248-18]